MSEKFNIKGVDFNSFKSENISINEDKYLFDDNYNLSITEKLITQIINMEDKELKQAIIDYARDYSIQNRTPIKLHLLDEQQVRLIIDLGIAEYIKRRNEYGK